MANSPLASDKATMKEFKITDEVDAEPDFKQVYIKTQIEEFKKLLWRSRTDLILSDNLIADPSEAMQEKGRQNRVQSRNDIKQFVSAIKTFQELERELATQ